MQVARKNSRLKPHFATAIVALRVARKVERPSTFRNVTRQVACGGGNKGNTYNYRSIVRFLKRMLQGVDNAVFWQNVLLYFENDPLSPSF